MNSYIKDTNHTIMITRISKPHKSDSTMDITTSTLNKSDILSVELESPSVSETPPPKTPLVNDKKVYLLGVSPNVKVSVDSSHYVSAPDTAQLLLSIGEKKARYPFIKMFSLSLCAGLLLGIGGLFSIIIGKAVPSLDVGLQKVLFGFFFSLGLNVVVFSGSELFTSNCAFLVPSFIEGKYPKWLMIKSHIIVYIGNFIGIVFVSVYFGKLLGTFDSELYTTEIQKFTEKKVSLPFFKAFLSGIGCNAIVCLGVFFSNSAKDVIGKVAILSFMVTAFVAIGFEHSIANMFFLSLGEMYGANYTSVHWIFFNLLPVTLGNFVGGTFLVGVPIWFMHFANIYEIPFLDPKKDKSY
ncbi:hypothetical protein EIN_016670 [Entamoeba invadens IP1]|uniref:hypothetical protein n=1 Tax=Entamoeba invadens IP1 TaxID=370355 RepID=UPI0002C3DA9A|nr:hypothetical protein EIN_016670 [Entamoeba invadens IP1]ELP90438.1 hypothetical protein EIN_016670 [Entamoeba invadens IP1]|eukprot:XP_004257209.1 hypothetical protein EIN_016670 [Entamoeba invadens IP1]